MAEIKTRKLTATWTLDLEQEERNFRSMFMVYPRKYPWLYQVLYKVWQLTHWHLPKHYRNCTCRTWKWLFYWPKEKEGYFDQQAHDDFWKPSMDAMKEDMNKVIAAEIDLEVSKMLNKPQIWTGDKR